MDGRPVTEPGPNPVRRPKGISTQNTRGEWVPAIPEPYYLAFGWVKCSCGSKFRGRSRYRGHYALVHILGMDR